MVEWTIEEKAKMFDEIAMHYYQKNFGKFSKKDIELLMFNFLIEKMIGINGNVLDYNSISDYNLSKILGITQKRIKELKVNKQLIYPIEFDWVASFAKLIENARYDKQTKKIIVSIPDPNLFIEIQNYIESQGGFVEYQLNSKILQMRIEYFLELAFLFEDDENSKKKIIKCLKKEIKEKNSNESLFDEKRIGKSVLELGLDITEIIANLTSITGCGNSIASALVKLIKNYLGGVKNETN